MTDPATPFEQSFADTAADHGIDTEQLQTALDRVAASVREYPGVHDLVYEYRRAFRYDPLVVRYGDAYYLQVPPRVWPEFVTAAELSTTEATACRAVHARLFDAVVSEPSNYPDDYEPLVLVA